MVDLFSVKYMHRLATKRCSDRHPVNDLMHHLPCIFVFMQSHLDMNCALRQSGMPSLYSRNIIDINFRINTYTFLIIIDTTFIFVTPFFLVPTSNKSTGQHLSENLASLPLYHCVLLCFQTGSSHVTQCARICAIVTQINTRTEDPHGTKRPFSLHSPCSSDKTVFLVWKWFYIHCVLLYCIVYLSTSSLCNF